MSEPEATRSGGLTLVGTPIGNLGDLTPRAISVLRDADVIAAEDTRRTRALLTHAGVPAAGRLVAVHEHNEEREAAKLVERMRAGARVAYVTDAGLPGVSDPGERLVRRVLDAGFAVDVVPGPSASLAALVVSGLPTSRFVFEGFLPRKGAARHERLAAIAAEERTVVLYESPHRLAATLTDLVEAVGGERQVAVARELTKLHEEVRRTTLAAAAAAATDREPRGEYVVVLGPAPPGEPADDDAVQAAVVAALATGATVRDAATLVAKDLGVSRRRAYAAATAARIGAGRIGNGRIGGQPAE